MPPEEVEKLIAELTAWCGAKYGRQTELADKLGVSKQLVANWLAGRRTPTLKHFFAIQAILREQPKPKSRKSTR
jgi:transcriptional regulator with XRE-family HTH domain